MVKKIVISYCLFILVNISFGQVDTTYFGITVDTRLPGITDSLSFQIPTTFFASGSYNYDVDWNNDGVYDTVGVTGDIIHTYATAGVKSIRIKGTFPSIYFNNARDKEKLISIDQWGIGTWNYLVYAFAGCSNMTYNATDKPILSNNTPMYGMFYMASSMNGDLSNWDVSEVNDFRFMFDLAISFNGDISS
jgi:surface protein